MGTALPWSIDDEEFGAGTQLVRLVGDSSEATRELRSTLACATAGGRLALVVDLTEATEVGGPLAWELCRAHERLLWRGGRLVAVADPAVLDPLLNAFGLHRAPDVYATRDDALADLVMEGRPRRDSRTHPTSPPVFAWRHQERPASWSFQLRGGSDAPRVARAAVGRLLRGRVGTVAASSALLAVSEMVTNSVVHGGAGLDESLELNVRVNDDAIRIEVVDPVGGFEAPEYPDDPLATHGRGLPLIHSLAQSWGIDTAPDGRVWFEIARPSNGAPTGAPGTDPAEQEAARGRASQARLA
jgi:anti-sigma regulatory factor (Ser/Thr protein kinase)